MNGVRNECSRKRVSLEIVNYYQSFPYLNGTTDQWGALLLLQHPQFPNCSSKILCHRGIRGKFCLRHDSHERPTKNPRIGRIVRFDGKAAPIGRATTLGQECVSVGQVGRKWPGRNSAEAMPPAEDRSRDLQWVGEIRKWHGNCQCHMAWKLWKTKLIPRKECVGCFWRIVSLLSASARPTLVVCAIVWHQCIFVIPFWWVSEHRILLDYPRCDKWITKQTNSEMTKCAVWTMCRQYRCWSADNDAAEGSSEPEEMHG